MDPINVKLDVMTTEDFTVISAFEGDGQFINQEIPKTAVWRRWCGSEVYKRSSPKPGSFPSNGV